MESQEENRKWSEWRVKSRGWISESSVKSGAWSVDGVECSGEWQVQSGDWIQ